MLFIVIAVYLVLVLLYRIIFFRHQYRTGKQSDTKTEHPEESALDDYGWIGESLIYDQLEILERQGARFLLNAYIPKRDGTRSEVDLIMVSQAGIFVIESKHYSGQVRGSKDEQYWTQIKRNREINTFYNPIRQNESHCLYIGEYLGLDASKFMSYIVFSDKCEFKGLPKSSKHYRILHRRDLLFAIKRDMKNRGNIFSKKKAFEIYASLYPLTQESEEVKRQHREDVRRY